MAEYHNLSRRHQLVYTVTQLSLRADRPEGWHGEWNDRIAIGTGFYLKLDIYKTILVTCKHIIEERASFVPEAALAALPIENWRIETFARLQPPAGTKLHFKPACHTLTLEPKDFIGLEGKNLTAALVRVENHRIFAIELDLLPTSAQLSDVLDAGDTVHSFAFPWPAEDTAGAGAVDDEAPLPDNDSNLPVLLTGNLAFPPHLKFRGQSRGVFTTSGSDLASTGGSPVFWWTMGIHNRASRTTITSTHALLLVGVHCEGSDEKALHAKGGNGLSFYLKSELLKGFETLKFPTHKK